jgi:hypothetical protein
VCPGFDKRIIRKFKVVLLVNLLITHADLVKIYNICVCRVLRSLELSDVSIHVKVL